MERKFFTSESVTEGHPDKICDAISDSILDAILAEDKTARVACETACTTGLVLVMGEISTSCYIDIQKIVRNTIREIETDFFFRCPLRQKELYPDNQNCRKQENAAYNRNNDNR